MFLDSVGAPDRARVFGSVNAMIPAICSIAWNTLAMDRIIGCNAWDNVLP